MRRFGCSRWATYALESQGFVTVPDAVPEADRGRLLRLLEPERLRCASRHPSGVVFGARHLLTTIPELGPELKASGVNALASSFLEREAFPVDAAYFDKQAVANWSVPVHQDRVLPVVPDPGRKHRSTNGIPVAEPSASALARLLAIRIHFDPTNGETGALFVFPGSHASGILTPAQIHAIPLASFVPCIANVGDALLMRHCWLIARHLPRATVSDASFMLSTLLSNQTMASGGEPPPNKPLQQTAARRRDMHGPSSRPW
jgi:hypothetical protein